MKIYVELQFKGDKVEYLENLPTGIGAYYKYEGNRGEIIRTLPDTYVAGLGEKYELRLHHIWDIARIAAEKATDEIHVDEIYFYNIEKICIGTPFNTQQITNAIVLGATTGLYHFDAYKTKRDTDKKMPRISVSDAYLYQKEADVIAQAYIQTRNLIEGAPNDITPDEMVKKTEDIFSSKALLFDWDDTWNPAKPSLSIRYFTEKTIAAIFPSLDAVGRGADEKPRMLVIEYRHPHTQFTKPILFIGKGICMDTGGDDSKSADAKHNMRMDMAGAANVIGALKATVNLGLPAWIVVVCPLAINKPGPDSYTQEMVIRTYKNGPTTLVRNTDAEGRVVLSDALRFGALEFDPQCIIELSTLTGAAMVSIGAWGRTIAMSNNDRLEDLFSEAADRAGQRVTFLPLDEEAFDNVKDKTGGADHVNVGNCGRNGGALTAAAFLFSKLQGEEKEWPMIHHDIAPTLEEPKLRGQEIRTLVEFIKIAIEKQI